MFPSVRVDEDVQAEDRPCLRIALEEFYLPLDDPRIVDVIGVVDGDVVAARQSNPDIDVPELSSRSRLPEAPDPVTVRGDDSGGAVGGRIVQHQHLGPRVGLGDDGVQALAHVALAVPHRNDDRHQGQPAHAFLPPICAWYQATVSARPSSRDIDGATPVISLNLEMSGARRR